MPTPVADTRQFALVDPETGDFVVGLANGVVIGEIGIHGVGAAWTTHRVEVTRTPDGLVAHYDGPGRLQRHAPLQLGLAAISASGDNDSQPVRLRFDVDLDAEGLGRADVWIEGQHYRVVVTPPPHTAGPVVTAVVAAYRAEDWSTLYDLTVRFPGMPRDDFVRNFGSDGSISELEITGDTVYRVVDGLGRASTPAHVVATIGQRHLDRDVAVQLVYRDGAWRFSSLAKDIGGT
jgi:hypothetical protein